MNLVEDDAIDLPEPPRADGSKSALEVLGWRPLAGDDAIDAARRTQLSPRVAAALRVALDELAGESAGARPLGVRAEGSALEIRCDVVSRDGLENAAEALLAVHGSLAPGAGAGSWRLRVPALASRDSFLMIVHDGVPLAVPWHSVQKFSMRSRASLESLRGDSAAPLVELAPPREGGPAEVPAILIGHGRKQGWLIADRLIWRMAATPVEPEDPAPWQGLTDAVELESGERCWVVSAEWMLRGIEAPPLERIEDFAGESDVESTPAEWEEEPAVENEPALEAEISDPGFEPEELEPAAPIELTAADVERLDEPVEPATGRGDLAALVAEDSITARIFLTRLIERHGLRVMAVGTAAELRQALETASWALVFVDVELPDARGAALLHSLPVDAASATAFVALVRDDDDVTMARAAGISRVLRKPFEEEALDGLVTRLGLGAER